MKEEQIIARIRTMTDLTEVEKQLAEVRDIQREVSSEVRSELADIHQWLKSSSLFTREDLDEELKELEPATKLQMTLARYEEERRKRKEELTGESLSRGSGAGCRQSTYTNVPLAMPVSA
jgi:hypothetical protein